MILGLTLALSSFAGENTDKKTKRAPVAAPTVKTADHLQNVSVTIRSEGEWSAGEGSGVIFTRKDPKGNLVNYVWTAAHVVDNLRSTRNVVINGRPKTIVEFKDPMVVKEIRQDGRTVGRLQMDAEVIKYSNAETGHDLALLRIRKLNFVKDTVTFHLDKNIPELGTDLLHVGSLLGQMGANSMTDGIYSQHGRLIKSLNKYVFDQTTVSAFPGTSGGGLYLKSNAKYVGMLVRGAGEGFNLIVPVRRMIDYCEKHKIMWSLDPTVPMPSEEILDKMPIEHAPESKKKDSEIDTTDEKMFPFRLRIIKYKRIEVREKMLIK